MNNISVLNIVKWQVGVCFSAGYRFCEKNKRTELRLYILRKGLRVYWCILRRILSSFIDTGTNMVRTWYDWGTNMLWYYSIRNGDFNDPVRWTIGWYDVVLGTTNLVRRHHQVSERFSIGIKARRFFLGLKGKVPKSWNPLGCRSKIGTTVDVVGNFSKNFRNFILK